jgi:phage terminase small subunit
MDILTERQSRFLQEYIQIGNATKAAINAGYSAHTAQEQGCKLLKHPIISKQLEAYKAQYTRESIANATELQERLTTIIRSDNEKTPDKTRAIELLAKLQGLMIERSETTQAIDMEALKNLSINELLDLRKTLSSKERAS